MLLHPTSLPSRFGIGDLGPAADAFLDWAAQAGLRLWQVLPPRPDRAALLALRRALGLRGKPASHLTGVAPRRGPPARRRPGRRAGIPGGSIDWGASSPFRTRILRASFHHAGRLGGRVADESGALRLVASAGAVASGLHPLRRPARTARRPGLDGLGTGVRLPRPRGARGCRAAELAEEIAFHTYVQFLFFRQWERVKRDANARGISIMGDLPIYVASDSADVWAHRRLFALDDAGRPTALGGRAARLLQRGRPALGPSALPMGRSRRRRATTGGSSASA